MFDFIKLLNFTKYLFPIVDLLKSINEETRTDIVLKNNSELAINKEEFEVFLKKINSKDFIKDSKLTTSPQIKD